MSKRVFHWFLWLSLFLGFLRPLIAQSQRPDDSLLDSLLTAAHSPYDSLLRQPNRFRLNVFYSTIDRGKNGLSSIKEHLLKGQTSHYYSINQLHLPLAILSLNKINSYKDSGLTRNTMMITEAASDNQMPAYNDPRWPDGVPTVSRYISNMLLLHDDGSFNRLYEWLGQYYAQQEFAKRGFDIRYCGRIGDSSSEEARFTNPVNFYNEKYKIILRQPALYNNKPLLLFSDSTLPEKNGGLSLLSIHQLFAGLLLPERMSTKQKFDLSKDDRLFLCKLISQLQEETINPLFDTTQLHENAFFDAFLPGKDSVWIFCSGGMDGSQLVETAYILNPYKGIDFFVTAGIDVGSGGNMNDALDFFNFLGIALYEYESKRPKCISPDMESLFRLRGR